MGSKTKTITLTSGWGNIERPGVREYRVEKVTDSIEYSPGQMISQPDAQHLCESKFWKVTILPFKGEA